VAASPKDASHSSSPVEVQQASHVSAWRREPALIEKPARRDSAIVGLSDLGRVLPTGEFVALCPTDVAVGVQIHQFAALLTDCGQLIVSCLCSLPSESIM
jgi:hypothetical protein